MAFTGKKISGQYFCSKKVPSPDRDNADGGHTCPRRRSIPAPAPRLRRSSAWGRGLASRPVRLRHAVAAESWSGPTRPVSWPQWEPTGRGRRSSLGGPAPPARRVSGNLLRRPHDAAPRPGAARPPRLPAHVSGAASTPPRGAAAGSLRPRGGPAPQQPLGWRSPEGGPSRWGRGAHSLANQGDDDTL